jgi:hypothetical protein
VITYGEQCTPKPTWRGGWVTGVGGWPAEHRTVADTGERTLCFRSPVQVSASVRQRQTKGLKYTYHLFLTETGSLDMDAHDGCGRLY